MIKKILIGIATICTLGAALVLVNNVLVNHSNNQHNNVTVGIIQTASHPALDAVLQGVTEELKKLIGSHVTIIHQNAEGSATIAHAIAQSFHTNKNINAIVTIGTLATQAAVKAEKIKPIIFTAVTNPQGLGTNNNQNNVCGISDQVDIQHQIDVLTKLLPTAKTIGILFNPAETNSAHAVKQMQHVLKAKKLTALAIGIQSESDVPLAATTACAESDALLLPTDNTIASTLKIVVTKAAQAQKPIICGDDNLVNKGVLLAAGGVDYKTSGSIAATLIKQILKDGQQPNNIVPMSAATKKIVINKQTLTTLNLTIPKELVPLITLIK